MLKVGSSLVPCNKLRGWQLSEQIELITWGLTGRVHPC